MLDLYLGRAGFPSPPPKVKDPQSVRTHRRDIVPVGRLLRVGSQAPIPVVVVSSLAELGAWLDSNSKPLSSAAWGGLSACAAETSAEAALAATPGSAPRLIAARLLWVNARVTRCTASLRRLGLTRSRTLVARKCAMATEWSPVTLAASSAGTAQRPRQPVRSPLRAHSRGP